MKPTPGPYTLLACSAKRIRGVAVTTDDGDNTVAVFLDGPNGQAGRNAAAWIAGMAAMEKVDALKKLLTSGLNDRVALSIVRRTVLDEP